MQIFQDICKCTNCFWKQLGKCVLYPGKNVNEPGTGCYVGIDTQNKQKPIEF